jgi:hypothetical protein
MMPMTLSQLKRWPVRIPVPRRAGGLHHDSSRARLTPDWLHQAFDLPSRVRLVEAEEAPEGEQWFCSLEAQWHLNSCMETSYDTIAWWLRGDVDRGEYYDAYRSVAGGLIRGATSAFADGRAYCAIHARRGDRGEPGDDATLLSIVSSLLPRCRDWAVVSDDEGTASSLRRLLQGAGCTVAEAETESDVIRDFSTLARARAVLSSVRGGWSAFPYAATRVSGAPLLWIEDLRESIRWRVIRAHSAVPISGVHHGPVGLEGFLATFDG